MAISVEYGRMKVKLGDYLTKTNCERIMVSLNWPPGKRDAVQRPADLIDKLEAEGIVGIGNYDRLINILKENNLIQAANVVMDFKRKTPDRTPVQDTGL